MPILWHLFSRTRCSSQIFSPQGLEPQTFGSPAWKSSMLPAPHFYLSFPEKLLKIVTVDATGGEIFSLKFTKYRLVAGLHPDPLGKLKRSPRSSSRNKGGPTFKGREGRIGRETEQEGREEERRRREGKRSGKGRNGRVKGGKGCGAPRMTILHDDANYFMTILIQYSP